MSFHLLNYVTASLLFFTVFIGYSAGLYEKAPHIIVFMADDLGWNDVGFHGSNQIPTPNIDALGYNGIILERHYVLPSSTPSRTAFYTGQYPFRMGLQGEDIRGGEPRGLPLTVRILPEHLRGLGYTTKLIGKWHMGYHTAQHTPLHRGFDSFLGFYNNHISYYDYLYSNQNMSGYDMHRGDDPAYGLTREYATDLFTDEAIRIIENHEYSRPLYLQISHLAVHGPLEQPDQYANGDFSYIREPNRRKYARMVSRLDNSVGRVVYSLGERGMLRDSLILFLTDNGAPTIGKFRNFGSNYPLRGTKYTLYEGGVRGVAALWSPKLLTAATIFKPLVHITDWLPTFYSAAGGNISDLGEIDGIDQWKALSEGRDKVREKIILNMDEVQSTAAVIYNRFKLLRGSVDNGYYDGYSGDSGKMAAETPPYNDLILRSAVSQSIAHHLGGPVTQPSTIMKLRQEATVHCRLNTTPTTRHRVTTCTDPECVFDLLNDPCETKNVVQQYRRVTQELYKDLENYGHFMVPQIKVPVDFLADPRRRNNTWEPWMTSGATVPASMNTAAILGDLVYCVHVVVIFISVLFNGFI